MDGDGDVDVVLGQMHTSEQKEVMALFNTNGRATAWQKQVVGTNGLHNGVVATLAMMAISTFSAQIGPAIRR